MKLKIITLLLVISLFSCSKSIHMTGNLIQDCNLILTEGTYNVKIYEEVLVTDPKYDEINSKLIKAIQLHRDFFIEYSKENSTPLPYHENFGVSESDYNYFINYDHSNLKLKETSESKLIISNKDNIISFDGNDDLEFMDGVEINLNDSTILMINNTLLFNGYVTVDSTNNIFESKWKGYKWLYTEGVQYENIKTDTLNMKYYSFTIGYLETRKELFMIIEGTQFDNGVKVVDFNAPMILNKL